MNLELVGLKISKLLHTYNTKKKELNHDYK